MLPLTTDDQHLQTSIKLKTTQQFQRASHDLRVKLKTIKYASLVTFHQGGAIFLASQPVLGRPPTDRPCRSSQYLAHLEVTHLKYSSSYLVLHTVVRILHTYYATNANYICYYCYHSIIILLKNAISILVISLISLLLLLLLLYSLCLRRSKPAASLEPALIARRRRLLSFYCYNFTHTHKIILRRPVIVTHLH